MSIPRRATADTEEKTPEQMSALDNLTDDKYAEIVAQRVKAIARIEGRAPSSPLADLLPLARKRWPTADKFVLATPPHHAWSGGEFVAAGSFVLQALKRETDGFSEIGMHFGRSYEEMREALIAAMSPTGMES